MAICAVTSVLNQDPRFQALKQYYADKNNPYSDDHLAQALQLCREYYGYEDDWIPSNSAQRGVFTRFLNNYLTDVRLSETTSTMDLQELARLYRVLYDTYSPEQLDARVNMLSSAFRQYVDILERKDGGRHTRQQIIEYQKTGTMNGYVAIMKAIFDSYGKRFGNVETVMAEYLKTHPNATPAMTEQAKKRADYLVSEYKKILDNKGRLAALASHRIGETEGFSVSVQGTIINFDDENESALSVADGENVNEDGRDESEGSKGDRYTDFRILKLHETLSVKARRIYNTTPKTDINGRIIRDDLGVTQYVGDRQAAIVLQRVLVNSTPDSMMADLEAASSFYPWLKGLIADLQKNPEKQTTVYTVSKKAETTYVYSLLEDGSYKTHIGNSRSANSALAREAGTNLQSGYVLQEDYSIYTGDGMIAPADKVEKIRDEFAKIRDRVKSNLGANLISMVEGSPVAAKKLQIALSQPGSEHLRAGEGADQMAAFLDANPDIPQKLAAMLRGAGFEVSEKDIRSVALQKMTKKGYKFLKGFKGETKGLSKNKLCYLVDQIDGIYAGVQQGYKYQATITGRYFFNTNGSEYRAVNRALALAQYMELDSRFLDGDKSMATYNNVNLLHQTIDGLRNVSGLSDEEYENFIKENYLKYEGMSLGYGDQRKACGWLRDLMDVHSPEFSEFQKNLRIVNVTSVNHVAYSELTREQKLTNSIVMYFDASRTLAEGYAAYEFPIQADYETAYDFIVAPSYNAFASRSIQNERELQEAALKQRYDEIVKRELHSEAGINSYKTTDENKIAAQYRTEYEKELAAIAEKYDNLTTYAGNLGSYEVDGKLYSSDLLQRLADEVLIEIERIDAINERLSDPNRAALRVYEEQGRKFQIFPAFNDNGFLETYRSIESPEKARDFIIKQIDAQMQDIVNQDIATIEAAKVLANPMMKNISVQGGTFSLYSEDGKFSDLDDKQKTSLINMFYNIFYARQQMTKLIAGGLEQFNGLADFEKRNMLSHAPRTSLYTNATWNGQRVGKERQTVAYIRDDESQSAFIKQIGEILNQLLDKKIITKQQYNTMLGSYQNIKTTDGQGFRTLDSYRDVLVMADKWSEGLEQAYINIKAGKPTKSDINCILSGIKPVYTGYEEVPEAAGEHQKPVRLTVLHKYSEQVLLPVALAQYCLSAQSVPLQGMAMAEEELAKLGKKPDLYLFTSGVKVGSHSELSPFAKDETGERILKTAEDIRDYIVYSVRNNKFALHDLEYKYMGIAASVDAHVTNERIAWASQAEKNALANMSDEDSVTIRGKQMKAKDARKTFYDIKTYDIIEQYKKLQTIFKDSDRLEKLLREELASKSYASRELEYALTHLADGSFALPLFSPNVEHQVQELFSSIMKKRLTKEKMSGANILQATSLGVDKEFSPYDNANALSEDDKLGIEFEIDEKTGKATRLKWVDCFVPLTDTRLLKFANEDGCIPPARLRELIKNGTIPESMLFFTGYRTPSDAEHSVIPFRIKGFITNVEGASIKAPKEIMVTTGHDNDGDKLRCHFKSFVLQDKDGSEIDMSDADVVSAILSGKSIDGQTLKCVVPEYDYSKSPVENSQEARSNARVEIIFSALTSQSGSARNLIPGGCDLSKAIAKTLVIVRSSKDAAMQNKIVNTLVRLEEEAQRKKGITDENKIEAVRKQARSAVTSSIALYDFCMSLSDTTLTLLMREINGNDTPFSYKHSADAFDYVMGGAQLISPYAMYNSAYAMFQRLNLRYVPRVSSKGQNYEVSLFGNSWTNKHLFDITDHEGMLATLALARLLNAAVDNNKEPILGHLGQTMEFIPLTVLMLSAGTTEEEVHLIFNQPAVRELAARMKGRDGGGLREEVNAIVEELLKHQDVVNDRELKGLMHDDKTGFDGQWVALQNISKMSHGDFEEYLSTDYKDFINSGAMERAMNGDFVKMQISVLRLLQHLNLAADNLSTFVQLTRPDSARGAFATTLADIITKAAKLNDFRRKLFESEENQIRFSGMKEVLAPRNIDDGYETDAIYNELSSDLPEVTALNTLLLDSSPRMFAPFFPQARQSWMKVATGIASRYTYKNLQPGIVERIGNDMILWKLLSDKQFVTGNPQEEQRRILLEVPQQVSKLKERINKATTAKETGNLDPATRDYAAEKLIGNAFLMKLAKTSPEYGMTRLMFMLNGVVAEGSTDTIRSSWNALLESEDEGIRNLAIDLFKYNLYTNGFSYGMYEFSHFAPASVLLATPHYISALKKILKYDWKDETEIENFTNQYCMNHWGDKKFLLSVNAKTLKWMSRPDDVKDQLWLSRANDGYTIEQLMASGYIVLNTGKKGETQKLYRVLPGGTTGAAAILVRAPKLGIVNKHRQVTRQYNPSIDYQVITSINEEQAALAAELREMRAGVRGISSPNGTTVTAPTGEVDWMAIAAAAFGIPYKQAQKTVTVLEKPVAEAVAKNAEMLTGVNEEKLGEPLSTTPEEMEPLPTSNQAYQDAELKAAAMFFGGTPVDMEMFKKAQVTSPVDDKLAGKLLHIVRRDESGDVVKERVPATPENIATARKMQTYMSLNAKLRDILQSKGVAVGVLSNAEARMLMGGVADFDTATVTAEGLKELIRVAEGNVGEIALPEEFAHVSLEMLGHEHPLVQRLLTALNNNEDALREAYDGMYDEYTKAYGEENRDKLVLEAAGKLVAKQMLREERIHNSPIRRLLSRVIEAIKSLLRRFSHNEVQDAIFEATEVSSQLARELLGGKLLDDMSLSNIAVTGQLAKLEKTKKDLTDKHDILSRLLQIENKRYAILKKRVGYHNKDAKSKALSATEDQIKKLEVAMRNNKTEDAILMYLSNSIDFLKATHTSLTEAVSSGRPANSICRKLCTVRDTLCSFAKAASFIRGAIQDNEIPNSAVLTRALNEISGITQNFYDEYMSIARTYFEEMLSSVYGEHGRTITVGKNKGRTITIQEMARKADHDISLASRWFNSIADCNDYVLKAIDDVTRDAKVRARKRAAQVRPKIEVAIADLVRETGSRDQSFMFEMTTGKDGKKHRTGYYISEKDSQKLTAAQKKFYDRVIAIKKEADACIPNTLVEKPTQMIMVRKYTMDRFKDAEGANGKALEAWEGLKNTILDTSDNFDPDYQEVVVDFEGNRVDMLPVRFVKKGISESFDDMTDDVATSLMAYAGMAFEYNELNGVVNILENAKYMAAERDVVQKSGNRTQRESIETETTVFREPFTKKAAQLHAQQALEAFYSMHIYGHRAADEGTIGKTRISKRKLTDFTNRIVSLSQMALNLPQRIANISTGTMQIAIETAGRGVFNAKDVAWASGIYMKESADRLIETGKTDFDNKLSLWGEYFDVHQDNGRYDAKYKKGRMSRIFNQNLLYAGLTMGEDYLSMVTSLATARNIKVKSPSGKTETLWDAYEVRYHDAVNKTGAYLALKAGYTKLDGTAITDADEKRFAKQVISLNFDLQGIYNLDDRAAVQQYSFGALIIMYRKWIAPSIKRRYGPAQYNALKGTEEEGYYRTLFRTLYKATVDAKDAVTEEQGAKALLNVIADVRAFADSVRLNWDKLTPYEKSNISRALTDLGIVCGLLLSCALLLRLPPNDHDGNETLSWLDSLALSQLLRLRAEMSSQSPIGIVPEAFRVFQNPFAALTVIQSTLNIFQLMLPSNYITEIKAGKYRGHKKAYKYFREFPIIAMFKKVENFIDPSPMIRYYQNGYSY